MKRFFRRLFYFKKFDHKEFMCRYHEGDHINDIMANFDFRYLSELGQILIKQKNTAVLYDISRYMKINNFELIKDVMLLNDYYLASQYVQFLNPSFIPLSFIMELKLNDCHKSIKCMLDSGLFDGNENILKELDLRRYKLDDI